MTKIIIACRHVTRRVAGSSHLETQPIKEKAKEEIGVSELHKSSETENLISNNTLFSHTSLILSKMLHKLGVKYLSI